MKKMFYTLALIVSSFFFLYPKVYADFDLTFNSSFLDDLDDLKAVAEAHTSSDYIITNQGGGPNGPQLYIIPSGTTVSFNCAYKWLKFSPAVSKYYINKNGNYVSNGTTSQVTIHSYSDNVILYSTIDIPTANASTTFNLTLGDYTTSFTCIESPLLTEYDVYIQSLSSSSPHNDELLVIESFYTLSITKLGYLAESIASNYIFLSIFVIFIFIFVFELIFRRYL